MDEKVFLGDLLEHGEMDLTRWEDDEIALRIAAAQGRHPYHQMTSHERSCFPEYYSDKTSRQMYLFIRNKILQLWQLEPNAEVIWENVFHQMCYPYNEQKQMIRRALLYLNRYGYINYGSFYRLNLPPRVKNPKRAVIIGAGMAGLAAAIQLESFGFDVTLLESSNRTGGRIHSRRLDPESNLGSTTVNSKNSCFGVDLGAEFLTGLHGNPMFPLMKQLSGQPIVMSNAVQLFDESGKMVEESKTCLTDEIYRKLVDSLMYLVKRRHITTLNGRSLSVQQTFNNLLAQLEYDTVRKQAAYYDNYLAVLGKLQTTISNIAELNLSGEWLEKKADLLEQLKGGEEVIELELDLLSRFQTVDLGQFGRLHDQAKERRNTLAAVLKDFRKNVPSSIFINQKERQILEWHFACLEGGLGSTLDQVPVEHFDPHVGDVIKETKIAVNEGLGIFLKKITKHSKVFTGCKVHDVVYSEKGTTVKFTRTGPKIPDSKKNTADKDAKMTEEDEIVTDAVICTVPLGVLKKNAIKFDPPLPEDKQQAIEKMGFGTVNKVVLIFDKPFWNSEQNYIGHLNPNSGSRGEFYLFTSVGKKPVITAMMSGKAAMCDQPNEVIVNNAMTILKNIFGSNSTPKQPKEAIITRWHEDENFFGTHSFVKMGADAVMHDTLAQSLTDEAGVKRIYFAGEHTYRSAPATISGAWLSGIRAAAEAADELLGQPFLKQKDEELVDLSDDEEVEEISSEQAIPAPMQTVEKREDDEDDIQILS